MKKIAVLFGFALLIAACKDTPKTLPQEPAPSPAPAEAPQVQAAKAEDLKVAAVNLNTGIKTAEDLRKKVDQLPDKIRKAKRSEIDDYYATLEGLIEKQTMMLNEINGTTSPTTEQSDAGAVVNRNKVVDEATLKDYTESVERYAKDAQAIQDAIDKMVGKKQ